MTTLRRIVVSMALLAVLAGCAGKSKDTTEPPAELIDFEATLDAVSYTHLTLPTILRV